MVNDDLRNVEFSLFSDKVYLKTYFVGETVRLPCGKEETLSNAVDWIYQPPLDTEHRQITAEGHGRLEINGSFLIVSCVDISDSGLYICLQDAGQGPKHSVNLTVIGKFRVDINVAF